MSFADKVKKMVENARTITAGTNINFGPMTVTPLVVTFKGKGNQPDKETLQEYMDRNGIGSDEDPELGKNESFQLHFDIDVSDLNPSLNFHYERDIAILESNHSGKTPILTDWSEIVLPSLIATFGDNWYTRILPNGKKPAPVLWVAAEQVESLKPVKEDGKVYKVPKFIAVYKNREECIAARDERYPSKEEASGGEDGSDEETEFSEELLNDVYALYTSAKKNRKATLKLLSQKPYENQGDDDEALLDAAVAANE